MWTRNTTDPRPTAGRAKRGDPLGVAPLRAGIIRAIIEGILGYAVLLAPTAVVNRPAQVAFILVALAWLVLWPAWRLRLVPPGPWWLRASAGLVRGLLVALALGVAGTLIASVLWSADVTSNPGTREIAIIVPCFVLARALVLTAAWLRRLVRRRLRWQLMVSHALVAVILLTVITAVGSVAGIQLLIYASRADAAEMAVTLAGDLRFSGATTPNLRQAQQLFNQVARDNMIVRGEPPLAQLPIRQFTPTRLLLLRPDGFILVGNHERGVEWAKTFGAIYGRPGLWARIRSTVLHGGHLALHLPSVSSQEPNDVQIGVAPLYDPGGRVRAIVLVQAPELVVNARQLVQGTLAIFTASTVAVILAAGLPILALSFLFSYVLARNLSRRLESVSAVATSIAGGDLSQRAPVGSRNEVGQLAEDVNRMAANLEATMGELESARARAEDALRARQELVASISHELRTPLAIIRAHLEGLLAHRPVPATNVGRPLSGRLSDAQAEDVPVPAPTLEALQGETERLSGLIDDLFALSRAETGGLQVQREPVDVAALVDEIATSMRPLVRQAGMLTLSVEARPGLPPAMADADRLRQILANLIRNAVRHTPEGGIIALSVRAEPPWVAVSVADTGEGIPAEHLPHVFDRFYRVDEARGRDSGGAGLGLAIVREFVELMGGKVTAESAPGEGSRFTVYLPGVRA